MKNGKLQLATVFSGIGAVEQALKKMKINYDIVFACDNGEREISESYEDILKSTKGMSSLNRIKYVNELYDKSNKQNWMKVSYFANYDIDENNWFEDIRFIDGKKFKGKVDLLVGGSPCQSFSAIGKRGGLEDTRGTLFYFYANLIKDMCPKVFIYENVLGMLTHDQGKTWETIKKVFNDLDYDVHICEKINAKDFGIPQDRKRIFVVGFKNKNKGKKFEFPTEKKLSKFLPDFLDDHSKVDVKHYLGEKGFKFVTNPKYRNRARTWKKEDNAIIQTQKANQQFNWNGDFLFESLNEIKKYPDYSEIIKRAFIGEFKGEKGVVRQLTHNECFKLMGFKNFKIDSNVPNNWLYRQSGNSIVVNVLENILKKIMEVENFE